MHQSTGKTKKSLRNNRITYSSDYSRWSESQYIPDDNASKEEELEKRLVKEKRELERFEEVNKEWCQELEKDMKKREQKQMKIKASATSLRLKGNKLFKAQSFNEALKVYYKALEIDPYSINILTNIALTYEKLRIYEYALDFCNRLLHINDQNLKGLYIRHRIYLLMKEYQKAILDLEQCARIDPKNVEVVKAREMIARHTCDETYERLVQNAISLSSVEKQSTKNESEDNLLIVPENCQNSTHDSTIKHKCQMIDNSITLLKESRVVISDTYFDDECFFQLLGGCSRSHNHHFATMITPFVIKLENCKVARTYMRISGHLDEMCEYVTTLYGKITNYSEGDENEARNYLSEILIYLLMIEKSVTEEDRSKLKIVEVRKIKMNYIHATKSFLSTILMNNSFFTLVTEK